MIFRVLQYGLGLTFSAVAALQDKKEYKIKNKTVLCFMILGFALSLFPQSECSPLESVAGAAIPLALLPLFVLKMLGAGDIKAFCALGAVFGPAEIIKIIIISVLCGGVIALGCMIARKNGAERLKYFWNYIKIGFLSRRFGKYVNGEQKDAVFRFAYAIAAGMTVYTVCKTARWI